MTIESVDNMHTPRAVNPFNEGQRGANVTMDMHSDLVEEKILLRYNGRHFLVVITHGKGPERA